MFRRFLRPRYEAHAHCDLMCGVYDPAQARIEAQSVLRICEKHAESNDPILRSRCIIIKEERAELVKRHLWVLWTDFFKPHHLAANPEIHDLFWRATKAAGDAKKSMSADTARELIDLIDQISDVFWRTDEAAGAGLYPPR